LTSVVTVNGPKTIWLLADRRLTYLDQPPKEDARKVMFLQTTDGVAILGYAGLGSTARGTEPADWMTAVLRGRNLQLEDCLGILAAAMKEQFPRHLSALSPSDHVVLVTAIVDNEARLYSIELTLTPDGKNASYNYRRWVAPSPAKPGTPPRFGITGSGAVKLMEKDRRKKWARDLLHLIRASDRRQVTPLRVADHLAKLNYEVHLKDSSVGPRCIVAWRHREEGGGCHQFYNGTLRESSTTMLPTIVNGMELNAIIGAIMPDPSKMLKTMLASEPLSLFQIDAQELNAKLAQLPSGPNEELP